MAGNQVTLTIAGESSSAVSAIGRAEQALDEVGQAAQTANRSIGSSEDAFESAARASGQLGEALDRASGSFSMLSGGIGDVGGAMTAFTDLQGMAEQAARDQAAASLAAEQAQIDYNEAVKEFGANSIEARAAALALEQAKADAEPPTDIEEWGAKLELISPIIMGIVGVTDLMILTNMVAQASWVRTAAAMVAARTAMVATSVATGIATAAQWAWNIAMTANPIGLIIVAVAALVAAIVWIATQTDWFSKLWEKVWAGILWYVNFVKDNYVKAFGIMVDAGKWLIDKVTAIPGLIGRAFSGLFNILTAPWRAAFNFIASAWNATVGRLRWTIPSWVPGVGGNSISAPTLPKFHNGGVVPGAPGQEMLAILQAGETVTPAGQAAARTVVEIRSDGTQIGDALVELLSGAIRRNGGLDVALGGRSG